MNISDSAISIHRLSWTYERANRPAISDVDLEVEDGQFLGVVGPNESGKSTLLYCIKGLIPNDFNGIWKGTVSVFGADVTTATALELAAASGLVFADPEAQFTAMTVEEELVFGLENLGLDAREIGRRLADVSGLVDIGELFEKSPYDLSGGQKQRVAIASVVAMRPRVLLLDEPTSMIDPLGKGEIFEILRRLKQEGRHTIVVVEHNLEELAQLCDGVVAVSAGRVGPVVPVRQFFDAPEPLHKMGLQPPQVTELFSNLRQERWYQGALPYRLDEAAGAAKEMLGIG